MNKKIISFLFLILFSFYFLIDQFDYEKEIITKSNKYVGVYIVDKYTTIRFNYDDNNKIAGNIKNRQVMLIHDPNQLMKKIQKDKSKFILSMSKRGSNKKYRLSSTNNITFITKKSNDESIRKTTKLLNSSLSRKRSFSSNHSTINPFIYYKISTRSLYGETNNSSKKILQTRNHTVSLSKNYSINSISSLNFTKIKPIVYNNRSEITVTFSTKNLSITNSILSSFKKNLEYKYKNTTNITIIGISLLKKNASLSTKKSILNVSLKSHPVVNQNSTSFIIRYRISNDQYSNSSTRLKETSSINKLNNTNDISLNRTTIINSNKSSNISNIEFRLSNSTIRLIKNGSNFESKLNKSMININNKVEKLAKHELIVLNKKKQREEEKLKNEYKIFGQNEWIFNFNVTQRTSIIILNKKLYRIETLIIVVNSSLIDISYIKNNLKCLVLFKNADNFHLLEPINIINIKTKLYKISFELDEKRYFNIIGISVVDFTYLNRHLINQNKYLLTFQDPFIISESSTQKTKNEIVNCMHMLRINSNYKINLLLNWIDIQYNFGYRKLIFYVYQVDEYYLNILSNYGIQKYNEKYLIEIQDYNINYDVICKWYIKNYNTYPHLFKDLYLNCLEMYNLHFNFTTSNILQRKELFGIQERLCTNDCLLKNRYKYELISNLDFDEFIFPRLNSTNNNYDLISQYNDVDKCNNVSSSYKYNIYEYAKRLIKKYEDKNKQEQNIERISSLHFMNIVFFRNNTQLIENIKTNMAKNVINFTHYENDDRYVNFWTNDQLITNNTIKYLTKLFPLIDCINRTNSLFQINQTIFDYKWINFIGGKYRNAGKSIHIGKRVSAISQHYTISSITGYFRYDVSIDDGYVNHMRRSYPRLEQKNSIDVNFLRFDFEYYSYISSLIFQIFHKLT